MKRKDILRKLEERLARGEINEKTYLEIKGRYESEPEEPEELGEADLPNADLGTTIGNVRVPEKGKGRSETHTGAGLRDPALPAETVLRSEG